MNYKKVKLGNEENVPQSIWSTDDNILCENNKTLRENMNNLEKIVLMGSDGNKYELTVDVENENISVKKISTEIEGDGEQSTTGNEISIDEPCIIAKFLSNSNAEENTSICSSKFNIEVYTENKELLYKSTAPVNTYTFSKTSTVYYIKYFLNESGLYNNCILENNSNIIGIEYIKMPTKASSSSRSIYSCPNLVYINEIDCNGSAWFPDISVCENLETINHIKNTENVIHINVTNCAKLNMELDSKDYWDREKKFEDYNFEKTLVATQNTDMPKAWGGTKSIPVESITFNSDFPTTNPAKYVNLKPYVTFTPFYADSLNWTIESASDLCKIDIMKTIRFVYTTNWNSFSGTEIVTLNSGHGETIEITLTK